MFLYNDIYYSNESCKIAVKLKEGHSDTITFHKNTEIIDKNFASGDSSIKKVICPKDLHMICDHAFFKCKNLSEVKFNNNLVCIDSCSFSYTALKDITFTKKVATIKERAFSNCYNLENVDFSKIKRELQIEEFAFAHTAIRQALLPDSVRGIPAFLFNDCENLIKLHIGKNTRNISLTAFRGCTSLEKITIAENNLHFKSINNCIIDNDTLLFGASLENIPKNVKKIGAYAFALNKKIKKITIPEGIEIIGANAFEKSSLEEVILPQSLDQILSNAFSETNLKAIEIPDNVRYVGNDAFYGNKNLKNVKWAKKCASITSSCFKKCTALENIDNLEKVIYVEQSSFEGCSKLNNVKFGTSLQLIDRNAFSECLSLRGFTLNYEPYITISPCAFDYTPLFNEKMKEKGYVDIAQIIIKIGDVEKLDIKDDIIKIEARAAFNNENLKAVVFPETLREIGQEAFFNCTALENIKFNEGLKIIKIGAFRNTRISSLTLPSSLTFLGNAVFQDCSQLYNISPFTCELNFMGEQVFSNTAITDISFLKNISTIPHLTFINCLKLKTASIPQQIKSIGFKAFAYSNVETLILNKNLTDVAPLDHIDNLQRIIFPGTKGELEKILTKDDLILHASNIKTVENLDTLLDENISMKQLNSLYKNLNIEVEK